MKPLSLLFTLLLLASQAAHISASPVPCLYQGRFRPLDCAAQLWLYDIHHKSQFQKQSAEEFMWQLHLDGHEAWDTSSLFWVHHANLKDLAELDTQRSYFSYKELKEVLKHPPLLKLILTQHFLTEYYSPLNRGRSSTLSLQKLDSALRLGLYGEDLKVVTPAQSFPWNQLAAGTVLSSNLLSSDLRSVQKDKPLVDEAFDLFDKIQRYENWKPASSTKTSFENLVSEWKKQQVPPQIIQSELEAQLPFHQRLAQIEGLLRVLPSKQKAGEWLPLQALYLHVYDGEQDKFLPAPNFTTYSDETFAALREAYFKLPESQDTLKNLLSEAYSQQLAGTHYRSAHDKDLYYPTMNQLEWESSYYSAPWIPATILLYLTSSLLIGIGSRNRKEKMEFGGLSLLIAAFLLHTTVLAIRCYILQRPPVSTMFETVVYVPWITVLASLAFYGLFRQNFLLQASSLSSVALLLLLLLTRLDHSMENVQAVLDSQYWLMVHVMMIVASYGVFVLCGILGHLYLWRTCWRREPPSSQAFLSRCILQTMYVGTALLIPATILGGVWAAESWGRFWDWDPKESWAFISSCIYLLGIHSFRYKVVDSKGLAAFSVLGLMSISFTWYGVNYILGTGLHSYGFGSGGEFWYYCYLMGELLFLLLSQALYVPIPSITEKLDG